MGFHVCEYCRQETSSGDYTLAFASGRAWRFPALLLHYVADHGYCPPSEFVHDVCGNQEVRFEAPAGTEPVRIGYLSGDYPKGEPTFHSFFRRLWSLTRQAERAGKCQRKRGG